MSHDIESRNREALRQGPNLVPKDDSFDREAYEEAMEQRHEELKDKRSYGQG